MTDDDDPGEGLTTEQLLERFGPGWMERVAERRAAQGTLGAQLQLARMHAKLTQTELAELSGVRQPDISEIERGGGNPTRTTLEKLGVALGIDFVIGASSAA
jgi:DNA-binding XRE family transcriptional regulator